MGDLSEYLPNGAWPTVDADLEHNELVRKLYKKHTYIDHRTWVRELRSNHSNDDEWKKDVNALASKLKKTRQNMFAKRSGTDWVQCLQDFMPPRLITHMWENWDEYAALEKHGRYTPCRADKISEAHELLHTSSDMKETFAEAFGRRDWLETTKDVRLLDLMQLMAQRLDHALTVGRIDAPEFGAVVSEWSRHFLSIDETGPPPSSMGALVLRWVAEGRFGVYATGLGHLEMIDQYGPEFETQEEYAWNKLKLALPLLFTDHHELNESGRSTRRCIVSFEDEPEASSGGGFLRTGAPWDSQDSYNKAAYRGADSRDQIKLALFRRDQPGLNRVQFTDERANEHQALLGRQFSWIGGRPTTDSEHPLLHLKTVEGGKELYLSSSKVIFVPHETDFNESKYCRQCLSVVFQPFVDAEMPCLHCGCAELIDLSDPIWRNLNVRVPWGMLRSVFVHGTTWSMDLTTLMRLSPSTARKNTQPKSLRWPTAKTDSPKPNCMN